MTSMKERNPFLPMDKPSFLPSADSLTAWETVIYTIHVMMAGIGPCRQTWENLRIVLPGNHSPPYRPMEKHFILPATGPEPWEELNFGKACVRMTGPGEYR